MRIMFFLFIFLIYINISTVIAQDKKLEIIGTVVGKDRLYGHIYDSNAVNKRLLIVRIDEKLKGKIDSKFILVNYHWRLKDEKTPYQDNNATQWKLKLTREKTCDFTLDKLQFSYFGVDKKITGILPNIDRTWGIDFENLPFNEILPCYKLEPENFSQIETFVTDPNKTPQTDTEFFVLKDSILINLPQAPLEIRIMGNGLFTFVNTSDKTIVNYTLGCILKKENEIMVTDKADSKEVNLPANSAILTPKSSGGTSDYSDQFKTCYDKKSKFTVIEVGFEDKSVWQAK